MELEIFQQKSREDSAGKMSTQETFSRDGICKAVVFCLLNQEVSGEERLPCSPLFRVRAGFLHRDVLQLCGKWGREEEGGGRGENTEINT